MKGQINRSILGPRLQRRLRIAPFGDYILDFVCLERRLVVELDGSQHAEAVEADGLRTTFLENGGFLVLRFWNNQVFDDIDGVLEAIWIALRGRSTPSPPRPSP